MVATVKGSFMQPIVKSTQEQNLQRRLIMPMEQRLPGLRGPLIMIDNG